jgi:hypothetical protein
MSLVDHNRECAVTQTELKARSSQNFWYFICDGSISPNDKLLVRRYNPAVIFKISPFFLIFITETDTPQDREHLEVSHRAAGPEGIAVRVVTIPSVYSSEEFWAGLGLQRDLAFTTILTNILINKFPEMKLAKGAVLGRTAKPARPEKGLALSLV